MTACVWSRPTAASLGTIEVPEVPANCTLWRAKPGSALHHCSDLVLPDRDRLAAGTSTAMVRHRRSWPVRPQPPMQLKVSEGMHKVERLGSSEKARQACPETNTYTMMRRVRVRVGVRTREFSGLNRDRGNRRTSKSKSKSKSDRSDRDRLDHRSDRIDRIGSISSHGTWLMDRPNFPAELGQHSNNSKARYPVSRVRIPSPVPSTPTLTLSLLTLSFSTNSGLALTARGAVNKQPLRR